MSSFTAPKLSDILFLDIETVHEMKSYNQISHRTQHLRSKKATAIKKREKDFEQRSDEELWYEKAGIFAEFGKIVVISVWRIDASDKIHIRSYYWDNEKSLLQEFCDMLDEHYCKPACYLCWHNAIEFDVPYLCRRALIHRLTLPRIMPFHRQKPRDMKILDTMQMRKFGDRKAYTSLDLLCNIFNISTPKSDIDGSQVSSVYWNNNNLERIKEYCERDVGALIEVYKRLC